MALMAASAGARALPALAAEPVPFSREWLLGKAREIAEQPYAAMPLVPEPWRTLSYDQYRSIWFDFREAEWEGTDRPYRVDFFAPGLYFERGVEVSVVEGGQASRVPFDLSRFDKTDQFPELPVDENMGYSGFRLRAELNKAGTFEEFAVFQGASYFRAIGTGQNYGLSARGLAINTGGRGGEEFPDFTNFWIETPEPGQETVRIHALLNSPSVAGAYCFDITPGTPATMEVSATLFPRDALNNVGIAPLTSMFLFDQTNRNRFDDFRPAVHDSEGLLIHNGAGELIWRPLANPNGLQISAFMDSNPQGFGLMQRSRDLAEFADLEAHYHNRPSLWVTPGEGWGDGSISLIEIPAEKEIYDNIVAYWRPSADLEPGSEHQFTYRLDWGGEPPRPKDVAPIINTRIGNGWDKDEPGQIVAIDFGPHPALGDLENLRHIVQSSKGTVTEGILQDNPATGGVRLSFRIDPGEETYTELRAQLLSESGTVSEVFLYRWTA
jgi:glucans biosynthesis protein